ncbi:MAG: endonuclease MutS2 [Eubacteriales bacterium]|nr:endonuclease MutS2 [Eubacteriales bacterium]
MNEKVLRIVEYDKIIARLEEHADSQPGKKLCRELLPMDSLFDIEHAQEQTESALSHLFRKGSVSFGHNRDFGYMFGALSVGSTLSMAELLQLAAFLDNVGRVRNYGLSKDGEKSIPPGRPARNTRSRKEKGGASAPAPSVSGAGQDSASAAGPEEDGVETDVLFDLFDCLYPVPSLSAEIRRCIITEDQVSDDASPALRKLRREMQATGDKVHQQLARMVNSTYSAYLQDAVITMRGDRYCIPVKAEYKSQVPGLIHDQSSSGSTLFIEPAAIVTLNNQLRELALQEKKEIEKILAALSAEAGDHLMELRDDAKNMTELDFIFARAGLAMDQNATRPVFNDRYTINIRRGRHPLIDPKKVVPIDIELGDTYDMVIITGPNTGGKTVTLKTVGLFELMGMAGLHIPAGDRSELSLFREVFADIGDEQSIEQSLSTFSSHMKTIVDIFRRVDRQCLCLFDELGAGTDPTEGAALAISILNFCHVRHIRTLATTHYAELKAYAMRTEGIVNASCEFNVETLQPTYHLMIGIPGKSNAFAISQKLGLPNYIIETAKEQLSQDAKNFEDLLADLEQARQKIRSEQEESDRLRAELEKEKKRLLDRERQFEKRREELLLKANEDARNILEKAKEEADRAISDLRKAAQAGGKTGDLSAMERTRTSLRNKVNEKNAGMKAQNTTAAPGTVQKKLRAQDIRIGDRVRVISMGLTGTVSALPDKKGKVGVRCGILQSKVDLADLRLFAEDAFGNPVDAFGNPVGASAGGQSSGSAIKRAFRDADKAAASGKKMDLSRGASVSPELNLLGLTTDDAIYKLDKYLDEARVSHLQSVRVVHGKGTGALRAAVHNYLRRQKWIKSYRLGDFGEGDAGVTIVTLRD